MLLYFKRELVQPKKRKYEKTKGEFFQLNVFVFYKKLLIVEKRVKKKLVRIIINLKNEKLHVSTNFVKKL